MSTIEQRKKQLFAQVVSQYLDFTKARGKPKVSSPVGLEDGEFKIKFDEGTKEYEMEYGLDECEELGVFQLTVSYDLAFDNREDGILLGNHPKINAEELGGILDLNKDISIEDAIIKVLKEAKYRCGSNMKNPLVSTGHRIIDNYIRAAERLDINTDIETERMKNAQVATRGYRARG